MHIHIHPLVSIYINTLLAWAKCFIATYGVYPGLYDLLDTPRRDFIAAQLHLHDSTLPRPLLPQSRGPPPTISSVYEALQPHLAPPPPDHLYICHMTRLSFTMSVCHVTSPSLIPTSPTVCLSPCQSVALSVHPTASPSVLPAHPSFNQSIHPPVHLSLTRQSAIPPVSPAKRPSDRPSPSDCLYTILPRPSGCPTSSDCTSTISTCPSDHPPLSHCLYDTPIHTSVCPSPPDCLTTITTRLPGCPSSPTIHSTQDSIHSLEVVNNHTRFTIHKIQANP